MTKRILLSLTIMFSLFLVFGCSQNSDITSPTSSDEIVLVQRPEFVDTRPQAVINAHIWANPADYVQSAEKKVTIPPDDSGPDPNPNPAHKYAFVVGISDYEGDANDLQYCDDDAIAMAAYFQSQGFTVLSRIDGDATADNIVAGLNWLAANAVAGDEIAFSYSGHGNSLNVGSVLISADLYYISHTYIMDIFNSANCTKKAVMIDACKAGSFLFDGETGSVVATASNNTYSYDAPTLYHGAWTYYWLEAANGSYIYAEDIATQAEIGMAEWAALYNVRISPDHYDKYTGGFDI
ncbi:MAG: caspase family protein [Candidatus Zixiibacteriota bacterium]